MLTLIDYPGRGIPDAGVESNIEYRGHFGFPIFICWRANDEHGKPVKVVIGFHTIKAARVNAVLINDRAAIQNAANAIYKRGDSEVVLFACAAFGPMAA